jgi:hypothetical protein
MTIGQLESGERVRVVESAADRGALACKLLDQIRSRLSGGARDLTVEVRHESTTVLVKGFVRSFYAKQLLYHLCRQAVPGYQITDTTTVGTPPSVLTA